MEKEKGIKTGGRVKGTPNKTTAAQRELLSAFMQEEFPMFVKMYRSLEPEDKVKTYVQLLPYVTPKMQAVQVDLEARQADSIDTELRRLAQDFEEK